MNWGPPEILENREKGLERGENGNFTKNDEFHTYETKLFKKLKEIFFEKRDDFSCWMLDRYSYEYERKNINSLNKLWRLKTNSLEKYKELISKDEISGKSVSVSMRVFFNYLDQTRQLKEEDIVFLRENIKIIRSKGIDTYVPGKKEIEDSIQVLKREYSPEYLILYLFIIQSGCRFTELKAFILEFNKKNIEESNEIISYRNFYVRSQKASYYLFFTKKLYESILKIQPTLTEYELGRFKDRIARNPDIISLKYLRKYNFTLLIESGISFEIANFIQGRTSQNIGFNHYLAKKVIAVKEYRKVLTINQTFSL